LGFGIEETALFLFAAYEVENIDNLGIGTTNNTKYHEKYALFVVIRVIRGYLPYYFRIFNPLKKRIFVQSRL
jgi:hypothetical protein